MKRWWIISILMHAIAFAAFIRFEGPSPALWNDVELVPFTSSPARAPRKSIAKIKDHVRVRSTLVNPAAGQPAGTPSFGPTGSEDESAPLLDNVLLMIRRQIENQLEYPISLQRRQVTGKVSLRLRLTEAGSLIECTVLQSSGWAELDRIAVLSAQRAAPFSIIDGKKMGRLTLSLPIEFKSNSR